MGTAENKNNRSSNHDGYVETPSYAQRLQHLQVMEFMSIDDVKIITAQFDTSNSLKFNKMKKTKNSKITPGEDIIIS